MPVEVILPRVDMDMVSAKISKWHVRDGDAVAKGAALFEIETDKAAMEIEAPASGTLGNILVGEGATAAVGSAVAFIYAAGEAITVQATRTPAAQPVASPPTITAAKLEALAPAEGLRATPLARRMARETGINLAAIAGSGPRGRIVADDVRKNLDTRATASTVAIDDSAKRFYAPGSFDIQPIDGMRRTIAQRLSHSKQTVPHFYLSVPCTLDALLAARQSLNARAPLDAEKTPVWRLSINDFIIKALAMALRRVPSANVTWTEDSILRHHSSDVGVAVAVEGGLFTPVLRAAETKTLSAISTEMKDLAARARQRRLAPAEYQGGTTAISNLGMFGIEQFTAIINPPHATILAVGAGTGRFVPVDGKPVLKTQMTCTLSCDHRVVDGAVGAELLQVFRGFIEDPLLMLA